MDIVPISPYERMRPLRESKELRIKSFDDHRWPHKNNPVMTKNMIKNYFYYIGINDKIQCVHCGGVISGFLEEDTHRISYEHSRHFPKCPVGKYRHPGYHLDAERLKSFKNWRYENIVRKMDLVAAGLFYTGIEDRCACHQCGNELYEWEAGDNPKEEHKRLFPDCKLSSY
ncbi:ORF87 [Ostreid herpesvirus 1]|nr:ORF87 [Ostreid herpesvirus 1]UCX57188.1 ORF87 [Ostreid herpesvirus 1]